MSSGGNSPGRARSCAGATRAWSADSRSGSAPNSVPVSGAESIAVSSRPATAPTTSGAGGAAAGVAGTGAEPVGSATMSGRSATARLSGGVGGRRVAADALRRQARRGLVVRDVEEDEAPRRASAGAPPACGSTVGSSAFMRSTVASRLGVASLGRRATRSRIWSCSIASCLALALARAGRRASAGCRPDPGQRSANSFSARNASSILPAFCIRSAYSRKFCLASLLKPFFALILPSL